MSEWRASGATQLSFEDDLRATSGPLVHTTKTRCNAKETTHNDPTSVARFRVRYRTAIVGRNPTIAHQSAHTVSLADRRRLQHAALLEEPRTITSSITRPTCTSRRCSPKSRITPINPISPVTHIRILIHTPSTYEHDILQGVKHSARLKELYSDYSAPARRGLTPQK